MLQRDLGRNCHSGRSLISRFCLVQASSSAKVAHLFADDSHNRSEDGQEVFVHQTAIVATGYRALAEGARARG